MKNNILYIVKYCVILLLVIFAASFFLVNVSHAQTGGGDCEVTQGSFRNYDYGGNFPVSDTLLGDPDGSSWFEDSVQDNNAQPYIYLDLRFSNDCIGDSVGITIYEQDTLLNEDDGTGIDEIVFQEAFLVNQDANTLIFKAGEEECDTIINGPNCYHYLELEIDGEDYDFSSVGVMNLENAIGVYYEDVNGQYVWEYLGFVNAGNFPGYAYSQYIADNDPDFLQAQEGDVQTGGQGDDTVQTGGQGDDTVQTGGQTGISTDVSEQIENPLGDGSDLPSFVESLVEIVMKAGIPLVVLALVYAGFRFVEARGKPEKLEEAKKILLYVVIGSLILLGAWTIVRILSNTLGAIIAFITTSFV